MIKATLKIIEIKYNLPIIYSFSYITMTINSLILELHAIEKQQELVVKNYQESITALKTKIHKSLMNTFTQSNLSEQKYILNRPYKWGLKQRLKIPLKSIQIDNLKGFNNVRTAHFN